MRLHVLRNLMNKIKKERETEREAQRRCLAREMLSKHMSDESDIGYDKNVGQLDRHKRASS